MSLFLCPVCRGGLQSDGHSLRCRRKHTFDLAAAGYVNLLQNGGKHSIDPGDSKEMCSSRHRFLSKGYYRYLAEGLAEALVKRAEGLASPLLLDAACGEGYYTAAMHRRLEQAGLQPRTAGVDISKYALKYAGKRCRAVEFAAASIFDLPFPDGAADFVTELFAPVADTEFRRVLKPGGLLILVGPGPRHLWELKDFLYDTPYPNEPKEYRLEGFSPVEKLCFSDNIHLESGEDVMDLFTMTPYFWKTSPEATQRLRGLHELDLRIEFEAHLLRKG